MRGERASQSSDRKNLQQCSLMLGRATESSRSPVPNTIQRASLCGGPDCGHPCALLIDRGKMGASTRGAQGKNLQWQRAWRVHVETRLRVHACSVLRVLKSAILFPSQRESMEERGVVCRWGLWTQHFVRTAVTIALQHAGLLR